MIPVKEAMRGAVERSIGDIGPAGAGCACGSLDDLEAILRAIERTKGSAVVRTHPGLVARVERAAAK